LVTARILGDIHQRQCASDKPLKNRKISIKRENAPPPHQVGPNHARRRWPGQVLLSMDGGLNVSASYMVVKAYVLVQAQLGRARYVAKAISKVRGVKMVHAVTGIYDVIAYLEMHDMTTLSELVIKSIQSVKGVERTHTAIVV
jgi:DNA-binding Lrp family transcriptional regulator